MLVHLGLGTLKLGLNSKKMMGKKNCVGGFRGMRRVTGESAGWVREEGNVDGHFLWEL